MSDSGSPALEPLVIIKVGGSLLDLPGLGPRLRAWLGTLSTSDVLLVPGGGATAHIIRELDRCHGLGEEAAHWLALRALAFNAAVLQALLPAARVIDDWRQAKPLCRLGVVPILDGFQFAQADETQPGRLPHCWKATSDSLAARVAVVCRARELILLKSATIRENITMSEATQCGYVDACFAQICAQADQRLGVKFVNFRELVT
jgi:5-(aminomethyl)-3-furanmethanol phosphate kinase